MIRPVRFQAWIPHAEIRLEWFPSDHLELKVAMNENQNLQMTFDLEEIPNSRHICGTHWALCARFRRAYEVLQNAVPFVAGAQDSCSTCTNERQRWALAKQKDESTSSFRPDLWHWLQTGLIPSHLIFLWNKRSVWCYPLMCKGPNNFRRHISHALLYLPRGPGSLEFLSWKGSLKFFPSFIWFGKG